jgi:hypothetical protein
LYLSVHQPLIFLPLRIVQPGFDVLVGVALLVFLRLFLQLLYEVPEVIEVKSIYLGGCPVEELGETEVDGVAELFK